MRFSGLTVSQDFLSFGRLRESKLVGNDHKDHCKCPQGHYRFLLLDYILHNHFLIFNSLLLSADNLGEHWTYTVCPSSLLLP